MFLVSSLFVDWEVVLMTEATVEPKDMSDVFNSLRNELLEVTEQVS